MQCHFIDRVTVSLHILYTVSQETEGLQDRLTVYIKLDCLLEEARPVHKMRRFSVKNEPKIINPLT